MELGGDILRSKSATRNLGLLIAIKLSLILYLTRRAAGVPRLQATSSTVEQTLGR